jgi:methyl-accepting chemotaxis protein/methyl-accepting chemotaxis protein-1 (serine sensor receptor)
MKSQMALGRKLTISFAAMLVLTLILGISSLSTNDKLQTALEIANGKTVKKTALWGVIDKAASDMLAGQQGIIAYSFAKSPAGAQKSRDLFDSAAARWEESSREMRPLLTTEEGKRLGDEFDEELRSWRGVIGEIEQLANAGNNEGALKVAAEQGLPISEAATRTTRSFSDLQKRFVANETAAGSALSSAGRWIGIVLILISLILGIGVGFFVRRTSQALQRAAAELSESAGHVANASSKIATSSQGLAQGASQQAASIEETSASAEEITAMTRQNADNSRAAAEVMTQTAQVVNEANHSLDQMQTSMREINASSDKVGKIIKVIDEIAFQTNILALNAAVEAARAGEAGMGFAVVADEVRNLAQRSAQAAKDTAGLIEESIAKSQEGRGKLDQVSAAIRNITESAQKVKALVDEVKTGSEEQANGIEQISKAMSQMEQVTQKSAEGAEETASAGQEMSKQAETLGQIVSRLRQTVGGSETGVRAGVRSPARQSEFQRNAAPARAKVPGGGKGLGALRTAVSHAGARAKDPMFVAAGGSKSGFHLDDDFKEF